MNAIMGNIGNVRRAWWIGGAVVCAVLALPAVPALAGALGGSAAASSSRAPELATLEIVAPGSLPAGGQMVQPTERTVVFVACPAGKAIGGAYALGKGAKYGMVTSAPGSDPARWTFDYPGLMPVGTKLSAVCW